MLIQAVIFFSWQVVEFRWILVHSDLQFGGFEGFNPCFVMHGSSLFMSAGVFVQARRYGS